MTKLPAELLSPAFKADPHKTFDYLRQNEPVHFAENINAWVLTRYQDAVAAMRDRRLTRANPAEDMANERVPLLSKFYSGALAYADLENHSRMRTILHKSFSKEIVAELQRSVPSIVDDPLDEIAEYEEIDFIREIADPLPAFVIAKMIGIPPADWQMFRGFSHSIKNGLIPGASADAEMRCNTALQEFADMILLTSRKRRERPELDLLSMLIKVEDEQGHGLSEQELISNCLLMLIAGHEAITNLLSNGMLSLLQHPEQLSKLKDVPELYVSAVEEMARYGRPMQMIPRYVSEDIEFGGRSMKKGQDMVVFLGSANYDPEVFNEPRSFNIERDPNPHLGFGYGIHYCFGAPLVRIIAPIAFRVLLERYPDIQFASKPPEYLGLTQDHVMKELWVKPGAPVMAQGELA
jgi:cytochrome P450